jgi:TonB family protein
MSQAMRRFGSKVTMIDRNGLDEKAIEAVHRWRFRPATLNGQPVATQIAVQVDFRLYWD